VQEGGSSSYVKVGLEERLSVAEGSHRKRKPSREVAVRKGSRPERKPSTKEAVHRGSHPKRKPSTEEAVHKGSRPEGKSSKREVIVARRSCHEGKLSWVGIAGGSRRKVVVAKTRGRQNGGGVVAQEGHRGKGERLQISSAVSQVKRRRKFQSLEVSSNQFSQPAVFWAKSSVIVNGQMQMVQKSYGT
jgi:hypothetical protein